MPVNHRSIAALPCALQRQGRILLNQQCWLWGQDIKRPEGNLLLQYGFTRTRPPEGRSGSSQYTFALGEGNSIRLWGSGMYFGGESGIYLNRFEFIARDATLADQWQAQALTGLPRTRELYRLPTALRWISTYERWILANFGLTYRKACLRGWDRNPIPPDQALNSWQELASEIEMLLNPKHKSYLLAAPKQNPPEELRLTYI